MTTRREPTGLLDDLAAASIAFLLLYLPVLALRALLIRLGLPLPPLS